MVKLKMFPNDQYVCQSSAASKLMRWTDENQSSLVTHLYERARKAEGYGLYYELVNVLMYKAMNSCLNYLYIKKQECEWLREMSVDDQEEYVRVYENKYGQWLKGFKEIE